MPTHRLRPFVQFDPQIHVKLAGRNLADVVRATPGEHSFVCGHCDCGVLYNVNPEQIQGFTFECKSCGGHSVFPQEHDYWSGDSRPPPIVDAAASSMPVEEVRDGLLATVDWFRSMEIDVSAGRIGGEEVRRLPQDRVGQPRIRCRTV